jgi:GT2 family glycosyltransferase
MSRTKPRFSVIVPTFRRDEALARCLAALSGLDYPREDFEVLVVADGEAPLQFESPDGLEARLVVRPRGGPGAARNAGALEARGRWLAFVDDDCVPDPDWLGALEKALDAHPGAAVRGRILNSLERNAYSDASQVVIEYLSATREYVPTMNFAIDAEAFAQAGGFDETFVRTGEDRDFSARWAASGRDVVSAGDAVIRHAHELGPLTFVEQHFRYGRGAFRYRWAAARRSGRLRFERPAFYVGLIRHPWRRDAAGSPLTRAALIAGAQLVTAGGFFWEAATMAANRSGGGGGIRTHEASRDA